MKKILFIANNIPTPKKSANKVIISIAKFLKKQYEVDFIYPSPYVPFGFHKMEKHMGEYGIRDWKDNDFQYEVLKYLQLPTDSIKYRFIHCHATLDKYKDYDLSHAHYIMPDGYIANQLYKKYAIPYCITARKTDMNYVKRLNENSFDFKAYSNVLKGASKVFTTNLPIKKFLEKTFGVDCTILPHGIEEKYLNYSFDVNNLVITCVGEFIELKRINWLIDSFIEIDSNYHLNIIGEGKLFDFYRNKYKHSRVHFLGKVNYMEVLKSMNESSIFVLPSHNETFGRVFLEAASQGNIVIGTRNDGIYGVFREDEMLFIESKEDLYNTLKDVLEHPRHFENYATKAFERASELTWNKIIDSYSNYYTAITN